MTKLTKQERVTCRLVALARAKAEVHATIANEEKQAVEFEQHLAALRR